MDEQEYETPLARAIATWQNGQSIPMDLFADLMEQGFDVPSLERRYAQ